jgi:hypothetical protein
LISWPFNEAHKDTYRIVQSGRSTELRKFFALRNDNISVLCCVEQIREWMTSAKSRCPVQLKKTNAVFLRNNGARVLS